MISMCKIHIYIDWAILWPKIGQRHFGARASHGHNLAIFHPILTNEHTKMTISLLLYIGFWPHFCSEASHGHCCTYGLKTTLKLLVHVLAIMASSCLKIVFLQKSGLNPPPPPPPPPLIEKGQKVHTKCYMISGIHCLQNPTSKYIKSIFLDLAKSGRSG